MSSGIEPYWSPYKLVVPLVQILGLTIHDKSYLHPNGRRVYGRGVYGQATVIDRGDTFFDVFNQSKKSPQFIDYDSSDLLLTCPDFEIIPSKLTKLVFDLHHTSTKRIAKGRISLERNSKEDWVPEYRHKRLPGGTDTLYAALHYVIYPYAVTATVSILYFSKDHDFDPLGKIDEPMFDRYYQSCYGKYVDSNLSAQLYGTVSASCVDFNHPSSLLFHKPIGDSQEVQSGGFIELSRSLVAVPAYSSLQINVSFNDANTQLPIASGTVAFKAAHRGSYKRDFVGNNGARIRVRVAWGDAYGQLYPAGIQKSLQVRNNESILPPKRPIPIPTVEVFSVVVCSKDGKPYNFYGDVNLSDGGQDCNWSIDKSRPQHCPTSGMLAIINGPSNRPFDVLDTLAIFLDLKDVNNANFIRGKINFSTLNVYAHENRRMCGVVEGTLGFGAVYFALIRDGVSAQVSVKVTHHGKSSVIVKGKIYARHGTRERSHPRLAHDENLFKSLLFCDGGVPLDEATSGSTLLPLVKSMVFLPRNSFLIIEADLLVSPVHGGSQGTLSLQGTGSFFNNDDRCKRIGEGDLYMDVSVKFANIF